MVLNNKIISTFRSQISPEFHFCKALCYKIFFYVLLLFCVSFAQRQNLQFTHLTSEDGVASNTIFSILQDNKGFLWFGTYDGLSRYDGYNFYTYRTIEGDSTSISEDKIRTMIKDKEGNLWIGTWQNGLNKFDPGTEKFTRYLHNEDNPNTVSSNAIISLWEDKAGNIWIGTVGGGLNKFDPKSKKFYHYLYDPDDPSSLSSNIVYSIYEDRDGILWVGTGDDGLNRFDKVTESFTSYKNDPANSKSISDNWIISLYEDRSGVFWIGTHDGGLNKFDKRSNEFIRFSKSSDQSVCSNEINSLFEDSQGIFWVGTGDAGLNIFDRQKGELTCYTYNSSDPRGLNDNTVVSICEDRSGILWFGTWNGGINKYNKFEKKFKTISHNTDDLYSLSANSIFSIYLDSFGDLWVGTDISGLNRRSSNSNKFIHYINNPDDPYSLSNNTINSICEDSKGNIWIGTDGGGLNRYDRTTNRFTHFRHDPDDPSTISSDRISQIFLDSKGNLWIGVQVGGFDKLPKDASGVIHYKHDPDNPNSINPDMIFDFNEDKEGNLWIGTHGGGLVKFIVDAEKFVHFRNDPQNPSSLSSDVITVIHIDKKGNIWVGTDGGGLNKFDSVKETFKRFKEKDGLPNNVICGILEDERGKLWISTYKGLSCFDPIKENFRNFGVEDGLQGLEFNYWAYHKGRNGQMYFAGSTNGLNVFYPDSIKDNQTIPPVLLTSFQLLHKPVSIGYDSSWGRTILERSISETKLLELNHADNIISFEFAALDFRNPQRNQYAYFLKGFDKNWTYTDATKRYVTYTNLEPGEYLFRVKGSNSDGIWNEAGTSLKIIIHPPWWATWWSYILYGATIILIVIGVREYDLRRQRLKHQLELEHEHAVKLEEIDSIKSRFFANISHEFRTPLTLILGPAFKIKTECKDENLTKQAGLIQRNANRLLELINQLLDLSKIEAGKLKLCVSKGNLASFVKGISMAFDSIAEKKDIRFKVKIQREKIEAYFDKDKMEKIITNLLSNAFKFTLEGGEITISLTISDDNTAKIIVHDNGVGISNRDLPKIFDRFFQAYNTQTKEHEGTGIGLALTKELVELHKGKISIYSQEGDWTEVTIELPLGKEHFSEDQIIEQEEQEVGEKEIIISDFVSDRITDEDFDEATTEKNIVLIVEDNPDVREYIREALIHEYNIAQAVNGEQGLRKAERIIPDLIVSDVMMPKMDGIEMLKQIKNDAKTSHIPVILLTAKSEQTDKLEGLGLGAEAYLTKPFDTKELQVRIKSLIEQRQKLQMLFSKGEISFNRQEKKLGKLDEDFMNKVLNVINTHLSEEEFSIEQFGKEAGMSRSQIHRKLKALTGKSPSVYLRSIRLSKAKQMIRRREATISEISYKVGFSSPAYFSRCFREEFGYPPSEPHD
jgi:signal transduction histidine kinase/ligand-binding sensor domain-containing protein/DNA-binding response OmpR family regulator